jgi:hypothetical protein
MIKRIFVVFCFTVACISTTRACDVCGCAASGIGIGLMTDYRSNFIRLSYFDSHFSSNPEHGHLNSSDVFTRMSFSFRYSFKKLPKLKVIGEVPYGFNFRNDSGTETSIKGFSDTRLIVNYTLLNTMAKNMKTAFYLEAGGGLSLPTGKYNADIVFDENLPENFNIGNGSLGYIFQMNAVLSHDKYGLLINTNYQLNSHTKEGYHFGNQLSSQLAAFREFPVGEFALIPNAGLLYERISSNAYKNGNTVPETGGEGLFFSSAINVKTEKWLAGVSYSLPIDHHYSGGAVDAGGKLAAHISYLF